jgi:Mn-dependent DtxR family transcriptional regulator
MYNKNKYIRIKDLSKKLNVRPSSVTNVIRKLKELNYVDYERYGIITLKEDGIKMGYFLLKRHNTIEMFFKNLGIKTNLDEIEILEHDININTLKEIYLFNKFLYKNKDIKEKYLSFKKNHHKNIDLYINKNP